MISAFVLGPADCWYVSSTTVLLLYYYSTTNALLYGSVGRTKKSSTWKVFSVGILEWSWLGFEYFGRAQTPPPKQLQVLLQPRTVPLLHHCCTTTVILQYHYFTITVLPQYYYCTSVLLLYCYCTTTVLLLYYCTTVLLYYYCTTTVVFHFLLYYTPLHRTRPQTWSIVEGRECRLEAKVFKMTGFQSR